MTDKLSGYSTTPTSNNAASPDGWPEGMTAGSVNNSDREFAARVREFYEDSQWIDYGHTIVSSTGSTIKLSTDVTSIYTAGRAIRINQDASMDGWVTASAYSAPDTSITVTGFTIAAPTQVEVGAIKDQAPLPNNLSITVASLVVSGTITAGSIAGTLASANITNLTSSTITATEILNSNGDKFTRVPNIDAKTTGTAASWSWPSGVTAVKVTGVGGGGAGGNSLSGTSGGGGGGGGAGTFIVRIEKVSGLDTITYTVGAAGAASTVVYNSVTYTASAGGAGTAGGVGNGGAGGSSGGATNGTINIPGGTGSGGSHYDQGAGGIGGGTTLGNGGGGGRDGANGYAATVYGAGGGGGGSGGGTGGAGAAGIVIFEY